VSNLPRPRDNKTKQHTDIITNFGLSRHWSSPKRKNRLSLSPLVGGATVSSNCTRHILLRAQCPPHSTFALPLPRHLGIDNCELSVFRYHCFLLLLLRLIFNKHSQIGKTMMIRIRDANKRITAASGGGASISTCSLGPIKAGRE